MPALLIYLGDLEFRNHNLGYWVLDITDVSRLETFP